MNTVKLPGFTGEKSIYKARGNYRMAAGFEAQNASANVQPALRNLFCRVFLHASFAAAESGDDAWASYWYGAWEGCLAN